MKVMGPIGSGKSQAMDLIQELETKARSRTEDLQDIGWLLGVDWRADSTEAVELSIRDTVEAVEQLVGAHQTARADRDEWQRKFLLMATLGWKINPVPAVIGFCGGVGVMMIAKWLRWM